MTKEEKQKIENQLLAQGIHDKFPIILIEKAHLLLTDSERLLILFMLKYFTNGMLGQTKKVTYKSMKKYWSVPRSTFNKAWNSIRVKEKGIIRIIDNVILVNPNVGHRTYFHNILALQQQFESGILIKEKEYKKKSSTPIPSEKKKEVKHQPKKKEIVPQTQLPIIKAEEAVSGDDESLLDFSKVESAREIKVAESAEDFAKRYLQYEEEEEEVFDHETPRW